MRNASEVIRRFSQAYIGVNPPTGPTVKAIYEKLCETGSVLDNYAGRACRPTTSRTPEAIEKVRTYFSRKRRVGKNPSNRKCAAKLNLAYGTVWSILHEDLEFKAYKFTMIQLLQANDKKRRVEFASIMLERIEKKNLILKRYGFRMSATLI